MSSEVSNLEYIPFWIERTIRLQEHFRPVVGSVEEILKKKGVHGISLIEVNSSLPEDKGPQVQLVALRQISCKN